MNYLIGIDGGATKSKCVVTDYEFNVINSCSGGPSNFLISTPVEAAENIADIIRKCFDKMQIGGDDIASIVVGAAGAGRKEDAAVLKSHLVEQLNTPSITSSKITVVSDAQISLEGAFSGEPGIILISGTGSICIGKNKQDDFFRVGGYGRLIGDEGSGFKLGQRVLSAALRSFDGRCLPTKLLSLVFEAMEVRDTNEIIKKVYHNNYDIASLAPLVIEAAKENDETALNIVDEQTDELLLHVRSMLQLLNTSSCKLAGLGSLIARENIYSEVLTKKLIQAFPKLILQSPEHPPEIGAVMLGRKLMSR